MTTTSKHMFRLIGVWALLFLLCGPAFAQTSQFICRDETDRIDCSKIEAAAQPLLDRGAEVAVYLAQRGDSSGADFRSRLRADDLASGDVVNGGLIAVYVSLDPRYAELRGGDQWNAALLPNDNISTIRTTKLVPALAAGNFTQGYIDTLSAIEASIVKPPQPGSSTPPTAASNGSGDTTPLAWSVFGIAVMGGGGYAALRWRKSRRALADARWHANDAKQIASAAIVDIDRALKTGRDKIAYDKLSYSTGDVEQLAAAQHTAEADFATAQTQFEAVDERLLRHRKPSVADYQTAATGYQQTTQHITAIQQQITAIDAARQNLDQLAAQAPAVIAQAKQQINEATRLLDPLGAAIANRERVLAPLQQQLAQAETALAAHDARQAIELAQATGGMVENLNTTVQSYSQSQTQIAHLRVEAAVLEQQGYRVSASSSALDEAQSALQAGAAELERAGATSALAPLTHVEPALERAVAHGRGLLSLRAENEQRLLALGVRLREVTDLLQDAKQIFDKVDEFAESTWDDIRGNGSEAEASAAEAETLWQRARTSNMLDKQEFAAAREDLNIVETALARATSLCEAITQRLHDLEHARAIAQEELATAAADLALGQTFLQSHDADIGKQPEAQLNKAAELLAQAQAEAVQPKPNWLELVRLAQAANGEADAALVGARSEFEVMEKLRTQVQHARQVASSEIERAERFYETHRSDMGYSGRDALQSLRTQLGTADSMLFQANQLAENERHAALQQAQRQFAAAQSQADKVYKDLYQAFQRAEEARIAAEEERRRSSSSSSWSSSSSSSSWRSSSSSRSSSSRSSGSSSGGSWGSGSSSGGGW